MNECIRYLSKAIEERLNHKAKFLSTANATLSSASAPPTLSDSTNSSESSRTQHRKEAMIEYCMREKQKDGKTPGELVLSVIRQLSFKAEKAETFQEEGNIVLKTFGYLSSKPSPLNTKCKKMMEVNIHALFHYERKFRAECKKYLSTNLQNIKKLKNPLDTTKYKKYLNDEAYNTATKNCQALAKLYLDRLDSSHSADLMHPPPPRKRKISGPYPDSADLMTPPAARQRPGPDGHFASLMRQPAHVTPLPSKQLAEPSVFRLPHQTKVSAHLNPHVGTSTDFTQEEINLFLGDDDDAASSLYSF